MSLDRHGILCRLYSVSQSLLHKDTLAMCSAVSVLDIVELFGSQPAQKASLRYKVD